MAQLIADLSDALAETVERGSAGVVRVEGRNRMPASGIIWSSEGIIVTAHHVLERDDDLKVGLPDGRTLPVTLAGRDATTDLAVLRTEASDLLSPTWVEPEGLRVGNLVLALGRPGKGIRATLGIVSALGPSWRTPTGGNLDRYLQTDLTMYPGFSGGPLVDAEGNIIGVNSSALLRSTTLTVPTPTVRRVVSTLLTHGRIRWGYVGVGAQPIQLPQGTAQDLDQETGLLLVSVEPGSPAEKGGLFLGDTIVSIDGQPVRQLDDLLGALSGDRIGTAVPVRILRGGEVRELSVTIGERT